MEGGDLNTYVSATSVPPFPALSREYNEAWRAYIDDN